MKGTFEELEQTVASKADSPVREDTGVKDPRTYLSGFTQGTVGFGLDAMAMMCIKLDGASPTSSLEKKVE